MPKLENLIAAQQKPSVDPMQAATMALLNKMVKKEADDMSNGDLAKGLLAAMEAQQKEIHSLVKTLVPRETTKDVKDALASLAKSQAAISEKISKIVIPENSNEDVLNAVNALRDAIQSVRLPEPDLTPLLVEMQKVRPNVDLKPIMDKLDADEEWEHTPEREDFSGKITRIVSKRIA